MPTAVQIVEFQLSLNRKELARLDGEIMRMERRGVSKTSQAWKNATARRAQVTEASRGWRMKYFRLTGRKWLHYQMPEWDMAEQYRREEAANNKAALARTKKVVRKQVGFAYSERIRECDQALALLVSNVNSAKNPLLRIPKNATGKQVVAKGVEEIGFGFTENFMVLERMIPWDVETNLIPKIRKAIRSAKSSYQIERHQDRLLQTHRHLHRAATLINQGMAAMAKYSSAVQKNGTMAIAYIKWSTIAVTAGATGAYGGVAGLEAVGVSMAQKTGEEGATLAARWGSGEKVTRRDLKKSLGEISLAGVTSAAGEIASAFAGPVAARLYKSPSSQQVDKVADVLKNVVANNSEQAFKSLENLLNGKPVKWDWWASAVAPLVPHDQAGAAVKDKDIRKGVAAGAK